MTKVTTHRRVHGWEVHAPSQCGEPRRRGRRGRRRVRFDLELDSEPREVTVPADFAAALEREAKAKKFFNGLSYSKQRWHVLSIEGAKSPETRQRRIEKSIGMLREGRAR